MAQETRVRWPTGTLRLPRAWSDVRPCPEPGCPELITRKQRACPEHRRQREAHRPQRMRGRAGVVRREQFLLENPLCRMCHDEGRVTAADEVDHVIALAHGGRDVWSNLQALCYDHHAAKTAEERRHEPLR